MAMMHLLWYMVLAGGRHSRYAVRSGLIFSSQSSMLLALSIGVKDTTMPILTGCSEEELMQQNEQGYSRLGACNSV